MKRWIVIPLLLSIAAWLAHMGLQETTLSTFWLLRKEGILLSGLLAYVMMAWSMVLSLRLPWLDRRLGGLDQVYLIHKWTGIYAAALVFVHWMICLVPKYMVMNGWLERPSRGPRTAPVGIEAMIASMRRMAEAMGEWAAYGLLVLVFVALIRLVPYHWFRRLHKAFPVLFLIAAAHSVLLTPMSWWVSPAGLLTGAATIVGCFASLVSLCGLIGKKRISDGTVVDIARHENGFLAVTCHLDSPIQNYKPGRFAFVRFPDDRDPHPFSIVSFDAHTRRIRFLIKPLGDDTRRLGETLERGMPVIVEGAYGTFDFSSEAKEQLWIAGGVGIAPFIARLEHLATERQREDAPLSSPVRLIYCTRPGDPMVKDLTRLCREANVKLELYERSRAGQPLDLGDVLGAKKDQKGALSLWFCGPESLGASLEKAWRRFSLPSHLFHREHFSMR